MKPFLLFLAVFAVSLLLVGVLPHVLRGQIISVRPSGFPPAQPAVASASSVALSTDSAIPQAGSSTLQGFGGVDDVQVLEGLPELDVFAGQMMTGQETVVTGVYATGLFALPIFQQPEGRPDYVSTEAGVLTQFSLPIRYGVTGLLAHNYLSGKKFFDLTIGQEIYLVYGDGRQEVYRVDHVTRFQALDPNNPFSRFIEDGDVTRKVLSSADLFNEVYTTTGQLVFQTCIEAEGDSSWGRIFITASPLGVVRSGLPEVGQFVSKN